MHLSIVRPTILYGSKSWTLIDKQNTIINAMEMRFLSKIEEKTSATVFNFCVTPNTTAFLKPPVNK